ncbi:uncharacterized protein [Oryza sativa Japonica Group]|uniref:Os05g0173500 protein n=2 Tax=Oryza TaxID=4527 RepID=A0A0P0WIS5_ORYSJ|nr:uncharacterized protein LOC4337952 isoform X3 [Oryza sativa Japonica Group]KAB8098315.1 hypothetical protein EE612_027426 [Oryza sativa]KAF2929384.1 hypothetical protein DAI22_05g053400 [Oryza sativa Japonica Group]BAS92502.1 Os05g0173500 [Oryza sativa Japonica Group]
MPKKPSLSRVASETRLLFSSWEPESPLDATSGSGKDAPADQQEGDGKRGRQRSPGDEARPKRQRKTKKKNKKQLDLLEREDDPLIQLRSLKDRFKGRLKEGVASARLKCLDTLLNESRDLSQGNESKGNLLKSLIQKAELDLWQVKELETDPTSGASQSKEEASAAASDGQGDDKERGDLQAVEAYGSPPGKEKVDLQAAKDSSPTAGRKGKGKRIIGYEAQQKESNIQDVKTSSQQETRKPKRKKQKKRQRRKMEESTENLSCRSGSSPSSSHDATSTSTIEGEPEQPSFGDLASIAQDHDDKIASDVVDIKQEQESAEDILALLDMMDKDAIQEKFNYYLKQLGFESNEYDFWSETYEPEQLTALHERLAIYRIVGYELSKGRKLGKQDIAKLKEQYNPSILRKEGYFRHYEESLEWYFDLEWCKYSGFQDYQRLVLHDNVEFLEWEHYHLNYNTYEDDLAYVRYRARLANETKWIEDYLARDITQAEWRRVKDIASVQALKIARVSGGVKAQAALAGFRDHIWSIQFDFNHYKDFDGVYFKIWKRVAKRKMNFREALLEVYREDMFPVRKNGIKYELDNTQLRFKSMKEKYDAHVACLDESVPEDEVRQLIKEAVIKMKPKPHTYLDYARKKLQISMNIDLITKTLLWIKKGLPGSIFPGCE